MTNLTEQQEAPLLSCSLSLSLLRPMSPQLSLLPSWVFCLSLPALPSLGSPASLAAASRAGCLQQWFLIIHHSTNAVAGGSSPRRATAPDEGTGEATAPRLVCVRAGVRGCRGPLGTYLLPLM